MPVKYKLTDSSVAMEADYVHAINIYMYKNQNQNNPTECTHVSG